MTTPRLYVTAPLAPEHSLSLSKAQNHYLRSVLRLPDGADVLLFNGQDGEWLGHLSGGKRAGVLTLTTQIRQQPEVINPINLVFAPLRKQRMAWLVEKATELGVTKLQPVITRFTQYRKPDAARLARIAIEAAEQSERLTVPDVLAPMTLMQWLQDVSSPVAAAFCREDAQPLTSKCADTLLIGPEGGFHQDEKALLCAHEFITPVTLGPQIYRAETAAFVGLVQMSVCSGL